MGILPEEVGDTVIAYTGITTKTGSDYDIDKMFLMIPSIDVEYDKEASVNSYINKKLRGNTIQDTINNIESILNQIPGDSFSNISANELAKIMFDETGVDNLNFAKKELIELVLTYEGSHPLINSIKDDLKDVKVNKLNYIPYNEDLSSSQQEKGALQNRLIELYKSILTNDAVIPQVLKPIDLDFVENDIKNMNPLQMKDDLMDLNAIEDIKTKYEFMLGKAGLGQNVNSLVDAVRGAMADLSFNNYNLGWGKSNENGDTNFDHEYSEELTPAELDKYILSFNKIAKLNGNDKLTDEKINELKSLKKIKLNDSMMALVNGFVDIAKDPYIVRGNWVTQTNNVGFMLLRAGVHPFKVNAFLSQPILKDYVKFRNNKESVVIQDTKSMETRFKLEMLINSIIEDKGDELITLNGISVQYQTLYKTLFTDKRLNKITNSINEKSKNPFTDTEYLKAKDVLFKEIESSLKVRFNITPSMIEADVNLKNRIKDLLENTIKPSFTEVFEPSYINISKASLSSLRDQLEGNKDVNFQLSILKKYNEWQNQAKKLADNVKASKSDTVGKGKDIISAFTAENLIKNILNNEQYDKELKGFRSKLLFNDKPTILKTYMDNSLGFSHNIMKNNPKFFITYGKEVNNTFNSISKASKTS